MVEVGVTPLGLGAILPEVGAAPTEIATTTIEVGVLQTALGGVATPVSEVATRLVRLNEEGVTFTWKNYADPDRIREMTLSGEEFLRRFLLHVLHDRFVCLCTRDDSRR